MGNTGRRDGSPAAAQARLRVVPNVDPTASVDPDGLLLRVAEGDHDAFAQLYDVLAPSVYGLARRVLGHVHMAEEVTQDVLLEVWQQAPRFDTSRGRARSWVLTLAHRRAVDCVRSVQAATDRDRREATMTLDTAPDDVPTTVQRHLEAEAVRRCLESLTDLQRQSVLLAYYGGHTHREVARLLDTPLGTVKTRLRDGLIRMRDCLGVFA